MAVTIKVDLKLNSTDTIIKNVGLAKYGAIQKFHDNNVLRRMIKYMPYKSGALIKNTIINTVIGSGEIVSATPYSAVLFRGKVMVNSKNGKGAAYIPNVGFRYKKGTTLTSSDRDINFNTEKNPLAGANWSERLVEHEGEAVTADLQRYIDYLARGK